MCSLCSHAVCSSGEPGVETAFTPAGLRWARGREKVGSVLRGTRRSCAEPCPLEAQTLRWWGRRRAGLGWEAGSGEAGAGRSTLELKEATLTLA